MTLPGVYYPGPIIGQPVINGTPGSVLFIGAGPVLAQNNAKFFWDESNARLGVGITTPTYLTHIQQTETGTSGTIAVCQMNTVLNPASASSAAASGFNVACETGAGNTQNFTNLVTGSFYQAFHRSTGTCTTMRAITANVQNVAGSGVVTTLQGMLLNLAVDATVSSSVEGIRTNLVITTAGVVANLFSFRVAPTTIVGAGVLTNAYGLYVQNLGGTGITNACGAIIYAQSGAATGNVGLIVGQTTVPAITAIAFLVSGTAAGLGAVVKGAASQTGDLVQYQDSSGAVLAYTTAGGTYLGPQSPGSTTVTTGKYMITAGTITLTGTQAITLVGTAAWAHLGSS